MTEGAAEQARFELAKRKPPVSPDLQRLNYAPGHRPERMAFVDPAGLSLINRGCSLDRVGRFSVRGLCGTNARKPCIGWTSNAANCVIAGRTGRTRPRSPSDQRIGCAALRSHEPGFIVGLEHCIALLTLNPLQIHPLAEIDPDLPGNRCNDGKCDREGRFWVGTCDKAGANSTGRLFRLDAAGALAGTVGPIHLCQRARFLSGWSNRCIASTATAKSFIATRWHHPARCRVSACSGASMSPAGAFPMV